MQCGLPNSKPTISACGNGSYLYTIHKHGDFGYGLRHWVCHTIPRLSNLKSTARTHLPISPTSSNIPASQLERDRLNKEVPEKWGIHFWPKIGNPIIRCFIISIMAFTLMSYEFLLGSTQFCTSPVHQTQTTSPTSWSSAAIDSTALGYRTAARSSVRSAESAAEKLIVL